MKRHVYARVTVNGTRREFSTKQLWYIHRWNQNSGRASDNKEDARTLNNFLDLITAKVYQAKKKPAGTG
ncbi:Arm DNA-binding domain-containing protein [Parapedobacter tibetensis]|uniref:Arm DNA-binding domain-containing protein n=1 Tax=Parapedobacter tibetensis TaxID=2972951 RepID=UPI00214DB40E|nr:Arm DNA-binding domain-containing protein [Parapedobacter tibetensis]